MKASMIPLIIGLCLATLGVSQTLLEAATLEASMYSDEITGILEPLRPTKLGLSENFHLPVETYEIGMIRTKLQLLPKGFPTTEVLAYASKINGKWVPQFPGPFISAFSDTPCYVIFTNELEGKHFLTVDYSPPFDMIAHLKNEIPTVPHLHGLETEMGSDGEPMAFWTKSGEQGEVYYSLASKSLKKNQAIYRYYNTKEGLYWYHDHTMAMTRINVYAGLAGLYEIINPKISSEEENILKIYGNVERKHFAFVDKSFNTDGSLNYPTTSFFPDFTSWVPGFSGNTILVNGKVWPKLIVEPKIYRFSLLNACQGRYLNVFFETSNGTRLNFEIFRRDSDFLKKAESSEDLLLINGGRLEVFVDFTNVTGSIFMRNDAPFPYPAGAPPTNFTAQIMRIDVKNKTIRNLQQTVSSQVLTTSSAESTTIVTNTFIDTINRKAELFKTIPLDTTLDYIDHSQGPKLFLPNTTTTTTTTSTTSLNVPSITSTIPVDTAALIASLRNQQTQGVSYTPEISQALSSIQSTASMTVSAAETAANIIRTSATSPMGNTKTAYDSRIPVEQFLKTVLSNPMFGPSFFKDHKPNKNISITNVPYPRFTEGKPFYTVLTTANNDLGVLSGLFMDGVPVHAGCDGAFFKQGETYDFYIVNTMAADHPIHIHLVNFQIIHRFDFNMTAYNEEFVRVNGVIPARGYAKAPKQIDPRPFRTSALIPPDENEKLFMDVIRAHPSQVTLARFKIANHKGDRFPFEISGMRYVYHCHILEHEDNEMMRYFCIE